MFPISLITSQFVSGFAVALAAISASFIATAGSAQVLDDRPVLPQRAMSAEEMHDVGLSTRKLDFGSSEHDLLLPLPDDATVRTARMGTRPENVALHSTIVAKLQIPLAKNGMAGPPDVGASIIGYRAKIAPSA